MTTTRNVDLEMLSDAAWTALMLNRDAEASRRHPAYGNCLENGSDCPSARHTTTCLSIWDEQVRR